MRTIHYWLLGAALVLGWLGAQRAPSYGTTGAGFMLDVVTGFIIYAVLIYAAYGIYLLVRRVLRS